MTALFARYGDIYRVYAPGRKSHTWVINHPDDVKRVLVGNHRNYTKGTGLDRVKILLGNGIMTSEGDFWRRQRYMMQPLFPPPSRHRIQPAHRLRQHPLHRKMGHAGRTGRAGQPHR